VNGDMKKAGRSARKKTGIRKGSQNMSLPGQVSKQLNKHYVNKYGVVRKSHRVNTQQT
jgi:hypothetical protein